jgi:glycerol transport system permease protein
VNRPHDNRAWLFLAPALVVVLFGVGIPLMTVINFSVQDVFYGNSFVWVGTKWFQLVLQSDDFRATLLRSLLYTALVLFIEMPLGVAIALRMPRNGPAVTPLLVVIAIPLLIPWFVVGVMWKVLIDPRMGLIGVPLTAMFPGFTLENTVLAWIAIMLTDLWHWTGLVVLLCYAGLTAIPDAYYHAASIDGASRWTVLRHIELPKMSRLLLIAILLRTMDSMMVFIEPFMLTRGGPRQTTTFISQDLLQTATQQFDFGEASAQSVIYFLIMIALCWTLYTLMERRSG